MPQDTRPRVDDLRPLARRAMIEHGLEPDFPPDALAELAAISGPAEAAGDSVADLRELLWASIDNDDSRDLDQLTVAEQLDDGAVKVLVAIADVDALVEQDSALDSHARQNTTSVYTAAGVFPMLPERLSTDLSSLNEHEDRLAVVVELVVQGDGSLGDSRLYRAFVRNQAKLAYAGVSAWLEGQGARPAAMVAAPGVDDQIRLQDEVAQRLKRRRHAQGALELETIEARPVVSDGAIVDLLPEGKSRSRELIEDFMIAANGAAARFLEQHGFPVLRRVVREPERWDRIVQLASSFDESLPSEPDARALGAFLVRRRAADPIHFADLSLAIVKLIGPGEYAAARPGQEAAGHFGLAVRDYSHSTAPNRRYPDLATHRLLKAALAGRPAPYTFDALDGLARHCTEQENNARRVERQVSKSAAAVLLSTRLGQEFDAIVTGASSKGTWVRILHPTVEGKVVQGFAGLDVGDRIRVRLVSTDVEHGFIDFARAGDG